MAFLGQAASADMAVVSPPADSIQCLEWSPSANFLLAGAWDNTARVWEIAQQSSPKAEQKMDGPVLDVAWSQDGSKAFLAGCDRTARMWDLATNQIQQVAAHDAPIKSCHWVPSCNALMTASWDKTVKFWDLRQQAPAATIPLPDRCYSADVKGTLGVVATAQRKIVVLDLTAAPRIFSTLDSCLRMQTRCIKCFNSSDGFAIGSIEGRVGIQYVEPAMAQKNNFSFKCHRDDGVHSINSISFHPQFGTFATAGSDGRFMFWDKDHRNRLKQTNKQSGPIPCGAFNAQGNLYAYAVSYDWHMGHEKFNPNEPNKILIHNTPNNEIQPKRR